MLIEELSRKKRLKHMKMLFCLSLGLWLLFQWRDWAGTNARWVPDYAQENITNFPSFTQLTQEEKAILYQQTGLSESGLQRLAEAGRWGELAEFQQFFFLDWEEVAIEDIESHDFTTMPLHTFLNSPISWEEFLLDDEGNRGAYLPLVPLAEGDILLTPNSRSFGWRQGHAGLVVDVEEWKSLECLVLGQNSTLQNLNKWRGFPAGMVLRVADESMVEEAVAYAMAYLLDVPYDLTVGVFSKKNGALGEVSSGTQCSHLVWQAFQWAGVDLDGNGGGLVTPHDLSKSDALEVVQIWGIDPVKMWN